MARIKSTPSDAPRRLFSDLVKPRVESPKAVNNEATCMTCGCTDSRACPGGCYWISVCRMSRTGLCSGCVA